MFLLIKILTLARNDATILIFTFREAPGILYTTKVCHIAGHEKMTII